MEDLHMLTTVDNPFDPFTEYEAWDQYDQHVLHYHTASFLARVVRTSDELSEADQDLAIEQAIDEIIQNNIDGVYIKVAETRAEAA